MGPIRTRDTFCLAIGALLLVFLLPTPTPGQLLQGSVTGNVIDPSGAAVPGAEVAILNTETGLSRTTTTNAEGQYSLSTVDAGAYDLSVTKEGFQAFLQQTVEVSINNVTRVDVTMQLGQVSEQITVTTVAAILQTDRAEVRGEVTRRELENLPVPLGRNYQMLLGSVPGVSRPINLHSVPSNPSRALFFSVNGTSPATNNTRVDGASQTNVWLPHMTAYTPALESIETVNIVTGSFDAEQGLAGGAAINLSIKSGTNEIHGSAFWHHNNQQLNAYPYFSDRDNPKPKFIYNQLGATIGGPIKKNKLFYFASYEGTRERTNEQRFVNVPTATMRQGDLSDSPAPIFNPFTGKPSGSGREPFPGNIIPKSMWSAPSTILTEDARWPLPNFNGRGALGLTQNYLGSGKYFFDRDTLDAKANFIFNDKWTSFARFSYLDYRMQNPEVFGEFGGNRLHRTNSNPGDGFGYTVSGTLSSTYVHSANLVFDGYFGATLMNTNVEQNFLDQNIGRDFLGIPGTNGTRRFEGGWPLLRMDGFETLGIANNFMPYFRHDPQWQIVANGTWTRGRHEIRFGTDLYWQRLNHQQPEASGAIGGAAGGFRFRKATTSLKGGPGTNEYNAMGTFLLGLAREAGRIVQYPDWYHTRAKLFSLYVRDRWQVAQRLTINLGLRWEIFPYPTRDGRGLERYDFDTNNMLICGTGNLPTNCGYSRRTWGFGPRIGLAFRATDTFVIRAGYGITNDPFSWARPLRTNYPILFVQNLLFANSRAWSTTLEQGLPPATPAPEGSVVEAPGIAAVMTVDDNAARGYIQSWNFTLEKRLPKDWVVSAAYIGTRSVRNPYRIEANWSDPGTGSKGRQLNQRFGRTASTRYLGSVGMPKYDGLQLRAEKRFSGGLMMNFNYTWSHNRAHRGTLSGTTLRINHPDYLDKNYGPGSLDYRHVFNWTGLWELPFGPSGKWATEGAAAAALGGWQINLLTRWSTDNPQWARASGNTLNSAGSSQFADCVAPMRAIGSPELWWDPASLADPNTVDPDTPRFGTCGSNVLRGPGLINFDVGLFRKFRITERIDLQFRAESFNISNTPHFSTPSGNISAGDFGVVTNVSNTGREGIDQRIFRLGLRLGW